MSVQAQKLYDGIKTVAKQDSAISQAADLLRQSNDYSASGNLSSLEQTVNAANRLFGVLNTEYVVRIVNRKGVNAGNRRIPTGPDAKPRTFYDANPELKNHYLIVEAVDHEGRILPVSVTNHETGITETVTMWGELVPHQIYERTGKDKKDNGYIDGSNSTRSADADILARKDKGYLNPVMSAFYQPLGKQITKWETTFK